MKYDFPHITHIDQVKEAIEGRDEFVVKHDEDAGYMVINYLVNFEDTFPPVKTVVDALLRECRGITFDADTGAVIGRKFHKFFNLNERPETQHDIIDFTQPHVVLEKLDGSMITPMLVDGEIRFCTKMGLTGVAEPVDEFAKNKISLHDLCKTLIADNKTPMFEWCSRRQRIVIDHPIDRLVLLAVRDNITGEYMAYDAMVALGASFEVEVVRALPGSVENIEQFMQEAHDLEGEEGYIIRFEDGHMVKIKGAWYVMIHKTLDHLRFEKDVIRLIIDEKLDDAKPFLPREIVEDADAFAHKFFENIAELAEDLYWQVQTDFDNLNGSKKKFADGIKNGDKKMIPHLFRVWDMIEMHELEKENLIEMVRAYIIKTILGQTGSGPKVDGARYLFGNIRWGDFHFNQVEE